MNCRKCKRSGKDVEMVKSQAMASTTAGAEDFPNSWIVTHYSGGPGRLVDCLKCPECGWSVSV